MRTGLSQAVRFVVSWTLFPGLLGSAIAAALYGLDRGFDMALVVMVVISASAIPILVAQRFMPAERDWAARPKHFTIDLLHMAINGLAADAFRAATFGVVLAAAVSLHGLLGGDLWPTSWPLVAQVPLALLVADFGAYWLHRWCHNSSLMWRIHAAHHSSEKMYVFAATRNHPMNVLLTHALQLLPLTLLGAPAETIALVSVFTGVHGMLQHANVDLRHGFLNHVFSTADLHRWHHSTVIEESNRNFGNNLIVWDTLFGTRYLPEGHPEHVGLGEDVHLPENLIAHLASPLFLNRLLIHDEHEPLAAALQPAPIEVGPSV